MRSTTKIAFMVVMGVSFTVFARRSVFDKKTYACA